MADSSALTPASYDQYIAGVLQDTDIGTLLASPKKAPKAAPNASLKAQAGPYDQYIAGVLQDTDVDKLLAPPKTGPQSNVAPEGGPMDDILGAAQGAVNTVKGLFTGVAGQAAGLLDIPVHAAGTKMGFNVPDPESVESAVAGFGDLHPGTRRGERASQLVQEGAGDILGAGGRAVSKLARMAGQIPAGPDTSFGAGFQSRFGISPPGVTPQNPEGIVKQDPEEQAKIEGVVNSALLPVLGGKPEARAMPLEESVEPQDVRAESRKGEPVFTPPDIHARDISSKKSTKISLSQKKEAPKAETPPAEKTAAEAPAATDKLRLPSNWNTAKLPNHLKGAKPSYGPSNPLKFESDVEKALYIVANPLRKSRAHDDYMDWLKTSLNMTEDQVMRLAKASRERTVGIAKTGKNEIPAYVRSPSRTTTKPAAVPETPGSPGGAAAPGPSIAPPKDNVVSLEEARDRAAEPPDLSRRYGGSETTHTPYPEGTPPGDFVMGKIRVRQGERDTIAPIKTEFEDAGDATLYKIGEDVMSQHGENAEPRPNTASPAGRQLIDKIRAYIKHFDPEWAQNDDRANLAYARAFARDVRDQRQRAYNPLRDHLEDNFPENPAGELRANPHKYALTTKVPKWQPRDLVTKCF